MTPLHAASAGGQITVVKHLLDSDVDVDVLNADGNSALHVACLNGQDIVVTELVSADASLNTINNKGQVNAHLTTSVFVHVCECSSRVTDRSHICDSIHMK